MRGYRFAPLAGLIAALMFLATALPAQGAVTREQVENAIKRGVRFLKDQQRADGSWFDVDNDAQTGTTSLVVLALLTAGEPPNSATMTRVFSGAEGALVRCTSVSALRRVTSAR